MLKGLWHKIVYAAFLHQRRFKLQDLHFEHLSDRYWRCSLRVFDTDTGCFFSGMAEDRIKSAAKLKSLAEAYERLSIALYESSHNKTLNTSKPYGISTHQSHKSARIMARAEYEERRQWQPGLSNRYFESQFEGQSIFVWIGTINGIYCSGYGTSKLDALDSAHRSHLRIKDFPESVVPFFQHCDSEPEIKEIGFLGKWWLPCWCIGYGI